MALDIVSTTPVINQGAVKANLLQERSEKDLAVKELKEYKFNKESRVKNGASLFLKAFLEMDPYQVKTTAERIEPYTTQKARSQIAIPGEGQKVTHFKISSKLTDMKLYYTPIDSDQASILATITREIAVDRGKPTSIKQMLELQLKLVNGKWIVDDVQLISQ